MGETCSKSRRDQDKKSDDYLDTGSLEQGPIYKEQWAISMPSSGKMQLKSIPVPKPGPGEVLVKVLAAPMHPSDLYFMKGMYDVFDVYNTRYPSTPGWEGAGVVVQSGGGLMAWRAMGKRVAFTRKVVNGNEKVHGGTYQQYCVAEALTLNILPDDMPIEKASMHLANPLTALGLLDRVQTLRSEAAVQTGAASSTGRMLILLCKEAGVPLINVVRRDEQVELLKEEYACDHVLNSNSPNFHEELSALAKELRAKALIECVGGELTGKLLECLPTRSTCIFYGALSEQGPSEINPLLLIGRGYKIESFLLPAHLQSQGIRALSTMSKCNKLMQNETLHSKIHKRYTLSQFQDCLAEYYQNMTAGKIILCPHELDQKLTDGAEFPEFDIKHLGV